MYSRILVPIDGSPTSQPGLDEALALARELGARLHLLNVVDPVCSSPKCRPMRRPTSCWRTGAQPASGW